MAKVNGIAVPPVQDIFLPAAQVEVPHAEIRQTGDVGEGGQEVVFDIVEDTRHGASC